MFVVLSANVVDTIKAVMINRSLALGSVMLTHVSYLQPRSSLIYLMVPCLLSIVIILLGWLCVAWRARRYRQSLPVGMREWQGVRQLPDNLSPALAALLASSYPDRVGWPHFLATLLDLLNRGILVFREGETSYGWSKGSLPRYDIVCLREPADLLPHESALLHIVFDGTDRAEEAVAADSLKQRYRLHGVRFRQALQELVREQDWMDARRLRERRRLSWLALSFWFPALLNVLISGLLLGSSIEYGWFLFLLFASWLTLACIGGVYLQRFSVVKDEWWLKAWSWREFFHYLVQVCTYGAFQEGEGLEMALAYLPYAAGIGLGDAWLRQFYLPVDDPLPPWFTISSSDSARRRAAFERTMYVAEILVPKGKRRAN